MSVLNNVNVCIVTQIRTNGLDIIISVSCFIYCKYYSMLSYCITVCSNTHFFPYYINDSCQLSYFMTVSVVVTAFCNVLLL